MAVAHGQSAMVVATAVVVDAPTSATSGSVGSGEELPIVVAVKAEDVSPTFAP